jgi:hypothetical protein
LGKSAHCEEKFQQIRRSLAGTIIAKIVPEVRVLFFKARLIEQVRAPLNVGGSGFSRTAADRRLS